jgi:TRAP-type C4-dicarboxylate transport system permease small subunit
MKQCVVTLSGRVDGVVRLMASFGLVAMLLLVMVQIVTRYLLNDPPAWVDEAARTIMVWTALLGATAAFRSGLDPKVMERVVTGRVWSDRLVAAGRVVAIVLFAGAVLAAAPGFVLRHATRTTDAMEWNSGVVVVIVPVFAVLLLVHLAAQVAKGRPAKDKLNEPETPGAP